MAVWTDLASLIARIGYLSNEKALDLTRQLWRGLAAAHERGVLHRDLKPANIMVDGRGRVRITDFGLAVAVGDDAAVTELAGTPAYMAPEQLAGHGATVRSDIYSLGLILYELYTGKRAFAAPSLVELRAAKEHAVPTAPSELRSGVDPIVERVLMRCLERDPRLRPGSVAQLAASLPGGDPLAAALAAGETPSPELVAASGGRGGLRPRAAVLLLVFGLAGLIIAAALHRQTTVVGLARLPEAPEALAARAREFLADVGYSSRPTDRSYGFASDDDVVPYFAITTEQRRLRLTCRELDFGTVRALAIWPGRPSRPAGRRGMVRRSPIHRWPSRVTHCCSLMLTGGCSSS